MDNIPGPSEQRIPEALNLFKAVLFPALIVLGFWMADAVGRFPRAWLPGDDWPVLFVEGYRWGVVGIISLGICALIIGMGILAHDAVHRVLFRSSLANEVGGALLSALALLPFYTNRQFHLTHHSYAHQPGKDPENEFHNRPFLAALVLGSLFALWSQYRLLFANLLKRFGDRRYQGRVVRDILALATAYGFYSSVYLGLDLKAIYTFVPVLLLLPVVFGLRAISDHYGLPAISRDQVARREVLEPDIEQWHREHKIMQREITGRVVLSNPVLNWLWSNVNYHEVHHKFPYLSYTYLPEVFRLTREKLPYAVSTGYLRTAWSLRKRKYYHLQSHGESLS